MPFLTGTSTPAPSPTSIPPTPAITQTTENIGTPAEPTTLRIWLPPQFDPATNTPAGRLLQARLNEFTKRRPGVRLEVRIKALDGPGGMLDALSSTSAAAPKALPDLIALPRPILEAAALKGLLHPFDGLTISLEDTDWYNYARELARLQNSTFGLPFAGDALILAYRPTLIEEPPSNWAEVILSTGPLAFPAADAQAICTLAFYLASGGNVQDEQGRPMLDAPTLAGVLAFYQQAQAGNLLLPILPQLETDADVWSTFMDGRSNLAITWASRYLQSRNPVPEQSASPEIFAAASLPTPKGVRYTLATGWVWALASHYSEQLALSVQLAEFLTQSEFLAEWTIAAGYLPPRSRALSDWKDAETRSLAGQWVISAHLIPSSDILSSLTLTLREATIGILEGIGEPAPLAQEALDRLNNP